MRPSRTARTLLLAALPVFALGLGCGKGKLGKSAVVKDVVDVAVTEDGFQPDHIPAKRGRPITLVFTRTTDKTCATEVVIASEHIRQNLPLNQPTAVSFIPEKAGDLSFACAMNMVKGSITVAQ